MKKYLLIIFLMTLTGCVQLIRPNFTPELAELSPGQYKLDPMHSYLLFRIDHLGLSKIVGRFNELDATLDFDPASPQSMILNGLINTSSIDLNNPDLESTLQEKDWFNSVNFPQLKFRSQTVQVTDSGQIEIGGEFTMRGVTQPLTVIATFNGGADNLITRQYTFGFSASAILNRSDYGMDSFSAFAGDEIEIELHGEFLRQ